MPPDAAASLRGHLRRDAAGGGLRVTLGARLPPRSLTTACDCPPRITDRATYYVPLNQTMPENFLKVSLNT